MSSPLYGAVRAVAQRRPRHCAVRDLDGTPITYGELIDLVDRFAAGLRARSVKPADTVAFALHNSVRYVALILAVAQLGARYVPLMDNFDAEQTARAIRYAEPILLVRDRQSPPDAPAEPALPTVSPADLLESPVKSPAEPDTPAADGYGGLFRFLWTSGSTGFPKMMAWRQDKFVEERHRWLADTGMRDSDVYFCRHTLDVAHATDLHVFAALLSGACLVLAHPASSPDEMLDRLQEERATVMSALPRHYDQLVHAARGRREVRLSHLWRPLCGGAHLSVGTVRDAADVLGIHIRQIYGSTEFGLAMGNMADERQTHLGMVPVRGVGVRIAPLAPGTPHIGELILRSPCTSGGYLYAEEANARTFRGGEFWTGDIARRLDDGSYQILGRVSEALSSNAGPLLAPVLDAEIASACPGAESVSLAVEPGVYSPRVLVVVRPAPGASATATRETVETILSRYGLDGDVQPVESIPHTPVGKADKPRLRIEFGLKDK
ncbi:class I adenylate-forming enzyme family protein [Microbispora sp. CA-102843]|uniref:class I adenylate-forming enzyme family protein n=1 Tax=Microbispora sp. CA-102843 TaxID=3239952 RepID=UPI003D928619